MVPAIRVSANDVIRGLVAIAAMTPLFGRPTSDAVGENDEDEGKVLSAISTSSADNSCRHMTSIDVVRSAESPCANCIVLFLL